MLLCGLTWGSQACVEVPPANPDDLCAIFAERSHWASAADAASLRWGVPVPVIMAFMHQESRFDAKARPGWTWFLGVLPLGPRSSAYGYGQVKDGTWADYRHKSGHSDARRDAFADVADFMGWYVDWVHRVDAVEKADTYHLYLAYHEGPGGFRRGSYRAKAWLQQVARKVSLRANRYATQYQTCNPSRTSSARAEPRLQKRSGRHTASLPPSM